MRLNRDLCVEGIPSNIPESVAAVCRSRCFTAVNTLLDKTGLQDIQIRVGTASALSAQSSKQGKVDQSLSAEDRSLKYQSKEALYSFDQLIVPDSVREELLLALDIIELERKVFDEWGLRDIEPFPRVALNFYGPPGTGKTLAAHAIASHIGRPIMVGSYAQIESMFHGEGPKNIESIFFAAERDSAVLFIDEADSLLSKRLSNVTQGSEQAINSMRSQLLICLEKFRGIVIFATNLVENYDKAFETRVRQVRFLMPDHKSRREIWHRHLPSNLPLASSFSLDDLARIDDVCGRDIKNAVINAALKAARANKSEIEQIDLVDSINLIKNSRIKESSDSKLQPDEEKRIKEKIERQLSETEHIRIEPISCS